MKRFATVLFCLAFVFGGIAGCTTVQAKPEAPAVVVPDSPPVVEEVATFVDVKVVKLAEKAPITGCQGNLYQVHPYQFYTTDSEGVERPTSLYALRCDDCGKYGLFMLSQYGAKLVTKGDTVEELRLFILDKIKGKPVQ